MKRRHMKGGKVIFLFFFLVVYSWRETSLFSHNQHPKRHVCCQYGFAGLNHKYPVKLSDTFFNLVRRHHEYQSHNKALYAGQTVNEFLKNGIVWW